jgi:hypothetical protein
MIECLGNREAAGTQSRGTRIVLLLLSLPFLAYYNALALDPDRSIHQFGLVLRGLAGVVLCAH